MKQQTRVALAATILVTAPALSMAAGTITFNGKVIDQTCVVDIDGAGNQTVTLGDVAANQLANPGSTAGLTPFVMNVTGCKQGTDIVVNMVFSGATLAADGTLQNMATGSNAATNVELQLLSDAITGAPIPLSSVTTVPAMTIPMGQVNGSKEFAVRYRSAAGGATVGDVTAMVNYDITYN